MRTLIAVALAGIGATVAPAGTIDVYLGTQGRESSRGIYLARLDTESGALSEPVLAAEVAAPGFLAWHPGGKFLYATSRPDRAGPGDGAVAAFRVADGGKLELLNKQSSEGRGPCHLSVDASGRCLMVANYSGGSVAALRIAPDGSLAKSASVHRHQGRSINESRQRGPHAHSIQPGPDNRFAYAPDLGIDKVMIYRLDPDKALLTPAGSADLPPGSGPRHMKFGRDGRQAYVLNELLLTVSVFDRDPESGGLTARQVVPTLTGEGGREGMTCSEVRVHPNGKFLYCANRDTAGRGRDSLSVFKVRAGGELELIQTIAAAVEIPRHINLAPGGGWLLVAGQKSGNVPVFRVAADGKLSFTGKDIKVANAMCVLFGRVTRS